MPLLLEAARARTNVLYLDSGIEIRAPLDEIRSPPPLPPMLHAMLHAMLPTTLAATLAATRGLFRTHTLERAVGIPH
eukprot:1948863-Rhodomonas_salina.1